jgi:hypothetical protein
MAARPSVHQVILIRSVVVKIIGVGCFGGVPHEMHSRQAERTWETGTIEQPV